MLSTKDCSEVLCNPGRNENSVVGAGVRHLRKDHGEWRKMTSQKKKINLGSTFTVRAGFSSYRGEARRPEFPHHNKDTFCPDSAQEV